MATTDDVTTKSRATPARTELPLREYFYWFLRYRRTWRGTIVISVINPLLFLIAIGIGIGSIVKASSAPDGLPYLAFFAPGMLAASAMQNGVVESAFPIARAKRPGGSYWVATATPLEPADIMFGHLMFMALRIALSALSFAIVMVILGAARSWLVILTPLTALLTGIAFATPVMAWAVTLPNVRPVQAVFKWVVMPLYLFSGTFFSVQQFPTWLRDIAYLTPLWHGVDLCRTLSLGTATWTGSVVHVAYLFAMTTIGLLVARRNYHRYLHP